MAELKGSKYYTVVTDIGQAKIANSIYSGKKLNLTLLKLGDGNGEFYNPDSSQTDVKKEVWRGNVVDVEIDVDNPNWINIYTVIAPTDGGFTIREMAVFDSDGDMIGICNCAETYKPTLDEGSGKEITMKMALAVVNTSAITLKIDPTIIYAKRKDVISLQTKVNDITAQLNDMRYEVASGSATEITLNITQLKDGYWKKFIAKADNGGATTTVNGKPLYKVCSTNPPNLKTNRPYEIYYNAAGDCFFLKASATGTTSADKVLAGETFSTENDTDLIGTMVNRGAPVSNINCGGTVNLLPGYYSGGQIIANSLASQTPSNADASKILSGYHAWVNGVDTWGIATIQSLGGLRVVSGSGTYTPTYTKTYTNKSVETMTLTVPLNLSFTPKILIVSYEVRNRGYITDVLNSYTNTCTRGVTNYSYGSTSSSETYSSTKTCTSISSIPRDSISIVAMDINHSGVWSFPYTGSVYSFSGSNAFTPSQCNVSWYAIG